MRIGADSFAIVTGAAGGIGSAVARELAARGASVALLDIDEARLEAVSATIPGCSIHPCDVTDARAIERLAHAIGASQIDVDILVTCAGVSVSGEFETLPPGEFERCMAVNFDGVVNSCRAFLPLLRSAPRRHRSAAICNVLSDFSLLSLPTKSAYAASKHAALAFSETLDAELRGAGITVTSAIVGATATEFVRRGYAVDARKQAKEAKFLDSGMDARHVARRIVKALKAGQSRVLIGTDAQAIDLASRISPRLVQFAARHFWRRIPFL